ncbi:MAG: dihydrofolate reductase family protein [Longimicrobiales bacterium]
MRRIINSTYISLDGVIERPHEWPSTGNRGSEGDDAQTELLLSCDALLMGRRTYEVFAPVWPTRSGDPFSDHINSMAKYVVSSTLANPAWNNTTVLTGDPVEQVRTLKEAPGKNIVQYGFGQLSFALMEHGLLDELRLWVHPLFVGNAEPSDLIYRHCPTSLFDLISTKPLQNGVVILTYKFAGTVAA